MALHRRSIDVVIDCQNGTPFFSPLVVGRDIAVLLVVHHVHKDQFSTRFSPVMAAIGRALEGPVSRFVYRKHTVVAVSPSTRLSLRRRLNIWAPVIIVPNGTPGRVLTAVGRSATPRLVCISRLVPHKHVDILLRAAAALRERWPKLEVDIVGEGPSRSDLELLLQEFHLEGCARLHGRVDEVVKADLLASSWLAVHPSMGEGWGITVMEAAAAGVPSLAFDVPGLRDSIIDGETGWLLPEGADLAAGIDGALEMLVKEAASEEWAERARAWAAWFSWEDSAARLTGVIQDELNLVRRRAAKLPERRRTDAACVLEVDSIDASQAVALMNALRSVDVVAINGNQARVLLYGCDERNGRRVAERANLTGPVRVRVAQHRDLLTVRGTPNVPHGHHRPLLGREAEVVGNARAAAVRGLALNAEPGN